MSFDQPLTTVLNLGKMPLSIEDGVYKTIQAQLSMNLNTEAIVGHDEYLDRPCLICNTMDREGFQKILDIAKKYELEYVSIITPEAVYYTHLTLPTNREV